MEKQNTSGRRDFFKILGAGSIGLGLPLSIVKAQNPGLEKPSTNIADALKYPKTEWSMPGLYPSSVIKVYSENSIVNNEPDEAAAYDMILKGMLELTGEKSAKSAFRLFFTGKDRIGLKVNPVAGKSLTTSHAVVKALIRHLTESGIKEKNLVIFDRREFQLHECGFTQENYPGLTIVGTERKDKNDSFYGEDGNLLSEKMIDREWYYWADVEGEYDDYTLPYMVNGGKYSYFTKICTQDVDKIINLPIMKNAGSSITMAMKNLAYGVIGNTGRLHAGLWAETCAEVCAFPPVRDKVVLNIADGIKGCFDGGPAANPQFFTNYKTLLFGTDPVAVDTIGYGMILQKRIEKGIQSKDNVTSRKFMELANELNLGECNPEKINLKSFEI
jgi:uncharacterized protein (DUF362 family)